MKINFKIEINYLNIDNYPLIERHFEEMARKGWLIDKVYAGAFFIYKRISPQALDFSISPYEIETALTRKSKTDLEEFQTVSKNVGWDYATKSYNLHIYYKASGSKAVPLHTDEIEEFRTLETIAKKYVRVQYFLLPFLLLVSWVSIGLILTNIRTMKDGFTQISALFIPAALTISVVHIFDLRRFLKKNRQNIENGREIEFNSSTHWLYRTSYSIAAIIILALFLYFLYGLFVLNNFTRFFSLLPMLIGAGMGLLYRYKIKPMRRGAGFKLGALGITMIIGAVFAIAISIGTVILQTNFLSDNGGSAEHAGYRVVAYDQFADAPEEVHSDLTENASLLIPTSYEYTSVAENNDLIQTEYAHALTEGLAENLVDRYIQQAQNALIGRHRPDNKEQLFAEAITKDNRLWQLDEVYYLNEENDEVILRRGKEVFYLRGLDFSDPDVVSEVKMQLEL